MAIRKKKTSGRKIIQILGITALRMLNPVKLPTTAAIVRTPIVKSEHGTGGKRQKNTRDRIPLQEKERMDPRMFTCPGSHQKTFIERFVKTRCGRDSKRRRLHRAKDFPHQERQSGRELAAILIRQEIQNPVQRAERKPYLPLYRNQS